MARCSLGSRVQEGQQPPRLPDPLFNTLFSYAGLSSAVSTLYDPTNGSVSSGDIVRFAGEGG